MKINRLLSVVLSLCILGSVSGCGGTDDKETKETNETAKEIELSSPGEYPVAKEKVTLTVGVSQNANIADWNENSLTKKLEEIGNVDLEFVVFPAADTASKISAMIASQTELPDILCFESTSLDDYYDTGLFVPLNDYYNDPNIAYQFNKRFEGNEEEKQRILKMSEFPDGNMYGMIRYAPEIGNEYPNRMWINKTWLDKLGLEIPTTTEEYYNVLKAFVTQDPNGNGKKDEIGLIGSTNGWNTKPQDTLMNAFIYTDASSNFLYVKDGKIDTIVNKPEFKEGLQYLNRLVNEGLLDTTTFTQDVNQLKTILENPDVQLVGSLVAGSMSVYQTTSKRKEDFVPLPPLTGPNGACYATYSPASTNCSFIITKYCDYPELAFRVFDYMYDETMSMWQRYGEPNFAWDTNVDGLKGTYEDSLGIPCGFRRISENADAATGTTWGNALPAYRPADSPLSMQGVALDENPYDYATMTAQAVPLYMNKHPEELVGRLFYTAEENSEIRDIDTSLKTFRSESVVRFITGDKSFDEWDSYVEELNNIGLERYLEIAQQVYDRQNKD